MAGTKIITVVLISSPALSLLMSIIICSIVRKNNTKKRKHCTQKVQARIVSVKHNGTCMSVHGLLPCCVIEYSFGNYDYKASLLKVEGNLQVGDTVIVYVDPVLPENVYIEGATDNIGDGPLYAATVCIFLVDISLLFLLFYQI